MDEQTKREAALRVLLDLTTKVQLGDVLVDQLDLKKEFVRVFDPKTGKLEYFNTSPTILQVTYRYQKNQQEEQARLEQYLKDHPGCEISGMSPDDQ